MTYRLFVFWPGSPIDPLFMLQSETPFPTYHRGDLIHPGGVPGATDELNFLAERIGFRYGIVLRVEGVEHFPIALAGEDKPSSHTTHVYTSAVHNVQASRPAAAPSDVLSNSDPDPVGGRKDGTDCNTSRN
jgi:hypothetical protein